MNALIALAAMMMSNKAAKNTSRPAEPDAKKETTTLSAPESFNNPIVLIVPTGTLSPGTSVHLSVIVPKTVPEVKKDTIVEAIKREAVKKATVKKEVVKDKK